MPYHQYSVIPLDTSPAHLSSYLTSNVDAPQGSFFTTFFLPNIFFISDFLHIHDFLSIYTLMYFKYIFLKLWFGFSKANPGTRI